MSPLRGLRNGGAICLSWRKGTGEKEATSSSLGLPHLSALQWHSQPDLYDHVTSVLNLPCSSEDLSLQVVRASRVALDPWGQESLQAVLGGKLFGSSQAHSDRQNQTGPALMELSDFKKPKQTKPNPVDNILPESGDTARIRHHHTLGS